MWREKEGAHPEVKGLLKRVLLLATALHLLPITALLLALLLNVTIIQSYLRPIKFCRQLTFFHLTNDSINNIVLSITVQRNIQFVLALRMLVFLNRLFILTILIIKFALIKLPMKQHAKAEQAPLITLLNIS